MLPRSSSKSLKETGWENDIQTTVITGPNPKIIELRGITRSNEIRGSRELYDKEASATLNFNQLRKRVSSEDYFIDFKFECTSASAIRSRQHNFIYY